ncbi:hypothetical protein EMCRGX_G030779 [Ephydatia muelleri]
MPIDIKMLCDLGSKGPVWCFMALGLISLEGWICNEELQQVTQTKAWYSTKHTRNLEIVGITQGPSTPIQPMSSAVPVNISHDLDTMAILRCGHSPIANFHIFILVAVVNLLAAAKAPKELSIYLSGGTLTALSKNNPNCPPDVRPIAVGSLTSQTGVQQGDLLGPFIFALVLHRMVTTIHTDEACAGLLQNDWYLDDGSMAGESSSVLRA